MADESVEVDLALEWETYLEKPFNVLTVGKIFRSSNNCLVVGGEDGMITVYELPLEKHIQAPKICLKELIKLETKGGPVQTLCLHDVTKFGSVDLIVGDSKGTLTFFGNKQILYKMTISEGCISAVTTDIDAAQNLSIIVGDYEGNIIGCLPHCTQWRLRLNDMNKTTNKGSTEATVTSILSIKLPISSALVSNYVIVAESNRNLHVLQNGTVIRSLEMPSVVNTMCGGYFISSSETTQMSPHLSGKTTINHRVQVALGMEDGRIFILNNFNLTLYANVKLSLTKMTACSFLDSGSMNVDVILCCGYFNSILVYHKGNLLQRVGTNDWVNSITVTPCEAKNEHNVYLGILDGSIQSYRLTMAMLLS